MSCFVHSELQFNTLAKYFREVIGLDADLTENLIFNLFQFELISVNGRYDEKNPVDIEIYEGREYEVLELISSYDALKFLDSIKYQAADMRSDVLWQHVLNVHKKLSQGIVKNKKLNPNYSEEIEYVESQWW